MTRGDARVPEKTVYCTLALLNELRFKLKLKSGEKTINANKKNEETHYFELSFKISQPGRNFLERQT